MTCVGIRSAGGVTAQTHRAGLPGRVGFSGRVLTRVAVPAGRSSVRAAAMTVRCSSAVAAIEVVRKGVDVGGGAEKFDNWMRESVGEIVKNLKEAPLFVHVYGGGGDETRMKAEKAVAEEWGDLKGRWAGGEEAAPEGIILVEELKEDEVGILEEEDEGQIGDCTKAWGVLVQGKGEDGGVACYLLKTSRVGCGNLGLFCTHYCLVKVKSFRETARSQLTNCWLV